MPRKAFQHIKEDELAGSLRTSRQVSGNAQGCRECSNANCASEHSAISRRKGMKNGHSNYGPEQTSCIQGSPSASIPATDQELRCFEFFRLHTVPQLCGIFESSFWNRLILQATHHQPAIRHAVIALGSAHEEFEKNTLVMQAGSQHDFASKQYLKAIRFLIHGQCSQNADLALMTCVLFVCFEILRGYHSAAFSHIDGGVQILSEVQLNTNNSGRRWTLPPNPYASSDTLMPIFDRLEAQMSMIKLTTRKLVDNTLYDGVHTHANMTFVSFSSLDEARDSMESIWSAHAHHIDKLGPLCKSMEEVILLVNNSKTTALHRVEKWSEAFEHLLHQSRMQIDQASQIRIHVLKIQKIFASILFTIDYAKAQTDETVWDNCFLEYKAINLHAVSVVKLSNNVSKSKKPSSTFTLDSGIIFPLYIVATKCRDKSVRWEAITILRSAPRQEGILSSMLTAHVVEHMVKIEEEMVPHAQFSEDIPNFARVKCGPIEFDTERKRALFKYEKWADSTCTVRSTIGDWISW